jgi:large subunit ribosomal protein L29
VTAEEIRNLGADELRLREREMREQLFRLRFQMQMGQMDGVKKYRALRKDLARLLTVEQERASAQQ